MQKIKDYLKTAQKEGWAIGQFNFSTLEQLRGIIEAASFKKSPVILGTSEGESRYLGLEEIMALFKILTEKYSVVAFLNLDHGKETEWVKKAISLGYPYAHLDGSHWRLEENIAKTKEICDFAKKHGTVVEGELGAVRGQSVFHQEKFDIEEKDLTDPLMVKDFITRTGIDALAVAIGNIHGVYATRNKEIEIQRLKKIHSQTDTFLVLHGGSDLSPAQLKESIANGITKVNFNTEMRIAWKESIENAFAAGEMKPYKVLTGAQEAVQKKVAEKIDILGSFNKA